MKRIIVTGWAWFIWSNFLNRFVKQYPEHTWINIDALTYAWNINNIDSNVSESTNYFFEKVDINDKGQLQAVYHKYKPTDVIHFAAESHVDNSINNPSIFLQTNILWTNNLLQLHKECNLNRFHFISTDEVYWDLPLEDVHIKFTEANPLNPHSPYSVSKASGDMLVQAFHRTYGINTTISRCSNNYWPRQHKEKLIPHFINQLQQDKKVSLYGDWMNVRDWIHVDDHNEGVWKIFNEAKPWSIYNLWWLNELSNTQITNILLDLFKKDNSSIEYVKDRLWHDRRYAVNCDKIGKELWRFPKRDFAQWIKDTVNWYINQSDTTFTS